MPSTTHDNLATYRRKRDASKTPEPFGNTAATPSAAPTPRRLFVVQQHQASHLHWDFRLEVDGVLRSWAVPKGPSPNPADKRFAALVEDHPLEYADFEGQIPEGNYGAGYVIVWDRGTYLELDDFAHGFHQGKLLFELHGHKLHGRWTLVRMKGSKSGAQDGKEWLLIKERDEWAREEYPSDDSVFSGMTLQDMPDPKKVARRLQSRIKRLKPVPEIKDALRIKPMLARPGEAFDRDGWVFEIKYDGYRLLIEKTADRVVLRSRNGHDLTVSFPELAHSAARLPYPQFVIDGEVVVHDERGVPSFSLLQKRARLTGEFAVREAAIHLPVTYYAFDLPQALGYDLRDVPLTLRKKLLQSILPSTGPVRYSQHIEKNGLSTFENVTR
ncbi:MAG: DNA ligase, partial [Gammaproteobacteria bacterium]|nr:DNA ligase [Gammaproteobacteria bacterium]